jgi:hypothetical protein
MWRLAVLLAGLLALTGCAQGMAGSPVRYCTATMGYARGTPRYKDCMNAQLEPYRQMDRANMQAGLAILGECCKVMPRRQRQAQVLTANLSSRVLMVGLSRVGSVTGRPQDPMSAVRLVSLRTEHTSAEAAQLFAVPTAPTWRGLAATWRQMEPTSEVEP